MLVIKLRSFPTGTRVIIKDLFIQTNYNVFRTILTGDISRNMFNLKSHRMYNF